MNQREIRKQAREIIASASPADYDQKTDDGEIILSDFLGTVFSIMPSGKYYMPWACSNVNPCPRCKGEGCDFCGSLGSREAHEDELMNEALEHYANKRGGWVESGEGDPCDLFYCEISTAK